MPNPGRLPVRAIGKRVRVMLANGHVGGDAGGWAADGAGGCRWSITRHPFDIAQYEIIE